jgi:hypothetical protein
MVVGSPRPAE